MIEFRREFGFSAALSLLVLALPAWAHHSSAAYKMTKTEKISGSLKEFMWGAPHSSLVVAYTGPDGKPAEVWVSTVAPNQLSRQGFKSRDLHVGDKVVLAWHPNYSGAPGGVMATLTLADGRIIQGETNPGEPQGVSRPSTSAGTRSAAGPG